MFKVKSIMKTNVITVTRKTPVHDAIELLVKKNITGLPVVNKDMTLAGIITEKDVLTILYTEKLDAPVEDFMTEDVITFDEDENLIDLADCFSKKDFRRVPVLANGKVVGIVSRKDIIEYILEIRKVGGLELAMQSAIKPKTGK